MGETVALTLRRMTAYAADVVLLAVILVPLAIAIQTFAGYRPTTGAGGWAASLVLISLPSWAYFTVFDRSLSGGTFGKRLLRLRVRTVADGRVPLLRALARTAIKLTPWELTHLAVFGLAPALGAIGGGQLAVLWFAYALLALFIGVALRTGGRRSVHDLVAGTIVTPAS